MMKLFPLSLIVFLGLVLGSCASRVQPNGGAKDTKAPKLISSEPANESTLFKGDKITLNFDEFVELKDGGTGIIVSPPLTNPPDISLKGKSIQIRFKETLDTSTTYNITLGKSVTDITEGNALTEMGFAFSTGTTIDSMRISGIVNDAYTNKPSKGVLVMLYNEQNDSLPYKKTPRYFGRTNEQGNYTIRNIKKGTYLIFALEDANSNYLFDQPDEKIGFQINPILVDTANLSNNNLRISLENQTRQRLLKKTFELPGKIILKYALPIDKFSIESKDGKLLDFYSEFKPGDDSLVVWVPKTNTDSLTILCKSSALGLDRNDTLSFSNGRKIKVRAGRNSKVEVDTLLSLSTNLENGKLRFGEKLKLTPNRPCKLIHPERIFWVIAKDTINIANTQNSNTGFSFEYSLPAMNGNTCNMICLPGAFSDIYSMENDTTNIPVTLLTEDDLGLLDFKIQSSELNDPFVIELLDSKNTVAFKQKVKLGESLVFGNLSPGKYTARIIADTNNDERWSNGIFKTRTPAERIFYYSGDITIRSGWDLELEWNLDSSKK
jgi:uncharacterized protein (DUF2141 family)